MEVHFVGKNSQLSAADREHVTEKLQRLTRFLRRLRAANVSHKEQRGLHSIEVTVDANGVILRAEEHDHSLRTAMDRAAEKVERQVRRFKGRLLDRWHEAPAEPTPAEAAEPELEIPAEELPRVLRSKRVLLKPMTVDEAALQMELLNHSFFAFWDAERDAVSVVYRRADENYGVLELETK